MPLKSLTKRSKNPTYYSLGPGALGNLASSIDSQRHLGDGRAIFFVDHFFKNSRVDWLAELPTKPQDQVCFVDTSHEPTTEQVDTLVADTRGTTVPSVIVGIGGGSTLDTAKAIANMFTNPGLAEDYQGWDLVKNPGVYKIGVPTLSGTGAEASRTCVLKNQRKNLKLGMNSEFTIFDELILDPNLTRTAPREQYFFTGMDTYIHCVESLAGSFRHSLGDAYSHQALELVRDVFLSDDMQSDTNREKLMVASYLGGSALANSFVGVVHPLSAALSMVFNTPHCVANCIVMKQMYDFYPEATEEFCGFLDRHKIELPSLPPQRTSAINRQLHEASVIHEKPLINALGPNYRDTLTEQRCTQLFGGM